MLDKTIKKAYIILARAIVKDAIKHNDDRFFLTDWGDTIISLADLNYDKETFLNLIKFDFTRSYKLLV